MPRTALVTGGASGLGAASAARLRAEGLTVTTLDVSGPADVTADVTDEAALREVAARIGPVDVLVNSAGIVGANKPLLETTTQEWRRVLDINVLGTVNTMRVFVPGMRDRGWGRVVNLASMAGKDGNTCRGLRLVVNAWRLYRQAVLQPALPRLAVLLALIPDADWVRDESGRKVLAASGAEGQQERASLRARRAVQLRMHAEGPDR
jgi:NAD(P)-dependent dehydrogenase (short-subunit alcohol dehydrogenase family)